ncbi:MULTISPECIES: hypothetical protein [Photorhabdus]|nr:MULTISPECIES: hypothetical protein [Photorhabdus]
MTEVSECSQQRGNLKDNGYKPNQKPCMCCGAFYILKYAISG